MANDSDVDKSAKRKQLQEDFVGNVTLHGYRYLFVSGKKRRCVWWLFFFGAIVFAIWLSYGAVSDYFEYKTVTTIEYDYKISEVAFPTLTLCFNQPYTKLYSKRVRVKNITNFIDVMFNEVLRVHGNNLSVEAENYLKQIETQGIDSFDELVELFAIRINDTLNSNITKAFQRKGCRFDQRKCRNDDFILISEFTVDSPCYQYNYYSDDEKAKAQKNPNKEFWFEAYFNIHDDDALGFNIKGKGMTLYIHDRHRPNFGSLDVTLQPGVLTTVAFEELKTMTFLPPPYGECGTRRYHIVEDFPYSYPMCKVDCFMFMESRYNKCGCVRYRYKKYVKDDLKFCSIKEMVECKDNIDLDKWTEMYDINEPCQSRCPMECTQHKYPIQVSTLNLLSDKHTSLVKKYTGWNKTDEEVDQFINSTAKFFLKKRNHDIDGHNHRCLLCQLCNNSVYSKCNEIEGRTYNNLEENCDN